MLAGDNSDSSANWGPEVTVKPHKNDWNVQLYKKQWMNYDFTLGTWLFPKSKGSEHRGAHLPAAGNSDSQWGG